MAAKRGSRRHSTTSFSENVVLAETSYQMLQVLSLCDRERTTVLTFLVNQSTMKLSGVYIFENMQKKLYVKSRTRRRSRPRVERSLYFIDLIVML